MLRSQTTNPVSSQYRARAAVGDWSSSTRSIHNSNPEHRQPRQGLPHENHMPQIADCPNSLTSHRRVAQQTCANQSNRSAKGTKIYGKYRISSAKPQNLRSLPCTMDLRKDASQQTRSIRCHQIPIDLTDRLKTNPAISRLSASPTPGNASRQSNAAQGVRETYIKAAFKPCTQGQFSSPVTDTNGRGCVKTRITTAKSFPL